MTVIILMFAGVSAWAYAVHFFIERNRYRKLFNEAVAGWDEAREVAREAMEGWQKEKDISAAALEELDNAESIFAKALRLRGDA